MVRRPRWTVGLIVVGAAVAGLLTAISPSSAAQEVRLTAAGDYGARAATVSVLDEVARIRPDAHLAVGDLAYGDSVDEYAWCGFVKQRVGEGFPFQLVSGNHESLDVNDGDINNFSACLPNQIPGVVGTYGREYYMDFPATAPLVRVIQTSPYLTFLDGRWSYTQGDAHYNWLSTAIDDARAKGAKWIVVTAHFPCQSVGAYTCSTPRDFYELLLTKQVDLVLHGHEHSYARTHQLRSGVVGCATMPVGTFDADCVADDDNSFIAGQGSVFATVGTGGTPLRNVNPTDTEAGYFATWSGLNANPTYGLLDIRVSDAQLAASFVPTSGGDFTDAFTITRDVNVAPVASFTVMPDGLSVDADASLSSDSDGTVTAYSWDFGDGSTSGVGPTTTHTYAAADTYTVSLTVTDDDGAASTVVTEQVTVNDSPPVPSSTQFDFDGDGKADIGVFRQGAWLVQASAGSTIPAILRGTPGDVPVPADYDGDGKTDVAVFRNGEWFVQSSSSGAISVTYWGAGTDVLVPADYDGDGKADVAVFRNGAWFIQASSAGALVNSWGTVGDVPVPADYDGDGKTDIAVFRDGAWFVQASSEGALVTFWGVDTDMPVPADYDGDGKTDIAVFRDGAWFVQASSGGTPVTSWGTAGDVPVPADFDGDGKTDPAVFRDGAWLVLPSLTGSSWLTYWGVDTDIPIPG